MNLVEIPSGGFDYSALATRHYGRTRRPLRTGQRRTWFGEAEVTGTQPFIKGEISRAGDRLCFAQRRHKYLPRFSSASRQMALHMCCGSCGSVDALTQIGRHRPGVFDGRNGPSPRVVAIVLIAGSDAPGNGQGLVLVTLLTAFVALSPLREEGWTELTRLAQRRCPCARPSRSRTGTP